MRDSLMLGPVPCAESCQQLGTDNYDLSKARTECKQYIRLLTQLFGEPPTGAWFTVTGHVHDFGTYHEVEVVYDDMMEEAKAYAFRVEANLPESWDTETVGA